MLDHVMTTTAAPCPYTATCPMFAAFHAKATLRVWQSMYCERAPDRCERLKAFLAGAPCPDNLLPNGKLVDVPLARVEPGHFE
jgi:hypothetical protein